MSKALVASNLATSSGHIGQEALKRSTRPDRSLDPLFNQSKLEGRITRDEIILGPMDIDDDRQRDSIDEMISRLRFFRGNSSVVDEALTAKAKDLGIQVNTLHNYTLANGGHPWQAHQHALPRRCYGGRLGSRPTDKMLQAARSFSFVL
jgi:hypothetical protein